MLTSCPECGLQVSDAAITCPHCGYPLKPNVSPKRSGKRKRMRLPNGFGQISEIKGKSLRKPFRAMVTVGKTEEGKPICRLLKPVAYFKTYNEAYEALVLFNKNPSDLTENYTMNEVFEKWYEDYQKRDLHPQGVKRIRALWGYLSPIHNKKIRLLKTLDLKVAIESVEGVSNDLRQRLKSLLNMIYDYAVMYEYTDKNYARQLKLTLQKELPSRPAHIPYTADEMNIMWENSSNDVIKAILIQCYSGWRPQELIDLKRESIDFEKGIMTGGMKTAAGRNRIVPIHSKIAPILKELYDKTDGNIFPFFNGYESFYKKFRVVIRRLKLNPEHKPHDGRKQFITMAKNKGVDEYAIKRIVGHAIQDITENVYTVRDIEWLKQEIEKV